MVEFSLHLKSNTKGIRSSTLGMVLTPVNIELIELILNLLIGSWNMAGIKFTVPAKLGTWGCLRFTIPNDRRDPIGNNLPKILEDFTLVLKDCGIDIGHRHPSYECVLPGNEAQNDAAIQSGLRHFHGKDPRPKILLVVIPSNDKITYSKIKYFGDTKAGIHTVCVVASKFAKDRNVQYHANVALKVSSLPKLFL